MTAPDQRIQTMTDTNEPRNTPWRFRITLAGLMLVMIVICLLGIPLIIAAKEKANQVKCKNHLSQLYKAMHIYIAAYGRNKYPPSHTGEAFWLCLNGCKDPAHPTDDSFKNIADLLVCPSTGHRSGSMDYRGPQASLVNSFSDPYYQVMSDPPRIPHPPFLSCDKQGNHEYGGNVLRYEGSVQWREDSDYRLALEGTE